MKFLAFILIVTSLQINAQNQEKTPSPTPPKKVREKSRLEKARQSFYDKQEEKEKKKNTQEEEIQGIQLPKK